MPNQPPRLTDVQGLPPMIDLPTAARYLGIGRTTAYALAGKDALPVPVVRIGGALRVPTAPLLKILGIAVPEGAHGAPEDDRTLPAAPGGVGGVAAGSATSAVSAVSGRRGREDPPRPPLRRARKWSVDRPRTP